MKRSPIAVILASALLLTGAASTAWAHNVVVSRNATTPDQGVDECGSDGDQDGEFTDPSCEQAQTGSEQKAEQQSGQDTTDTGKTGQQGDSLQQDTPDGQQRSDDGENED